MLTGVIDKDASRQPNAGGDIHWHWQRPSNNFASGGVHVVVEGIVECGGGSWYALGIVTEENRKNC